MHPHSVETHDCPGGCGRRVLNTLYACRLCWRQLPPRIQADVQWAWRSGTLAEHATAMAAAADWYAQQRAAR